MRDEHGLIEFPGDDEPTEEAMRDGFMTYRIIGVNPRTGNRIAQGLITPKGFEFIKRDYPLEDRDVVGGIQ
jgi:hypothetical protein